MPQYPQTGIGRRGSSAARPAVGAAAATHPSFTHQNERIAGIVVADATVVGFPMTYVSPGFEELTGYRAEEVLGRSCSILQGPDTDPRAVDVLRQAIATSREAYVTLLNYRKDGTTFWNEVALAAQHDAAGSCAISRRSEGCL